MDVQPMNQRSKFRLLFRLARPHFLVPGFLLYILGVLLAVTNGANLDLEVVMFGYLIFFLAHLSVSFSNDYFDRETDQIQNRTSLTGGSGVLLEHPELASVALHIAILLLVLSGIGALLFTWYYSYSVWFLLFALAGGLLGWFYTAPPLQFAYRGLGEASTAIGSGLIMPGMGYMVVQGSLDLWFLLLSFPLMCYGLFFILTVEMPDVESDRLARKSNLLVRHGINYGVMSTILVTGTATTMLWLIAFTGILGNDVIFWYLALGSIFPFAIAGCGLRRDMSDRKVLMSQVRSNFTAMMSILGIFIALSAISLVVSTAH